MYIRPSVVLASPARFGSPHAARITADHSRAASGHGLHHPALHVATIPSHSLGTGPQIPAMLHHLGAAMR